MEIKKILSLIVILSLSLSLSAAQKKAKSEKSNTKENAPAVIYSLPKTVLKIELEVSQVTEKPGLYFNYSDRFLALKNVVTEYKTYWEISGMHVTVVGQPDKNKTFLLSSSESNNVQLTREGLICGINYPCTTHFEAPTSRSKNQSLSEFEKENANIALYSNMVLTEDQLVANSTAKMAENAAKQIYRIRDSRLSLITGENDKVPSDGESLQLMLKRMDQSEQALVELFAGKKTKMTIVKELTITPEKGMKNEVIFRFSTINGLVEKDDLSGAPISMTVTNDKNYLQSASTSKESGFFYNIPSKARIEISFGDKQFYDEIVPVAQFGSVQALPKKLGKKAKIKYEAQTGAILSIEK